MKLICKLYIISHICVGVSSTVLGFIGVIIVHMALFDNLSPLNSIIELSFVKEGRRPG